MAKRPQDYIKSDRGRKIGVIDTNIFMNLVMFDKNEEFMENKLLFQFLNQNNIDPTKIIQEDYEKYSYPEMANIIRRAIQIRNEKYEYVSRNLNHVLYKNNMIPAITETIKLELLNNTSLEDDEFQVNPDRLGDNRYIRKVVSRYFYERYRNHIQSFIQGYQVLPLPKGEQSVIGGIEFGRESQDAAIYDTCLFYEVYAIITNNKKDFRNINRKLVNFGRIKGEPIKILSPSFSHYDDEDKFLSSSEKNESLAVRIIRKMNSLLFSRI